MAKLLSGKFYIKLKDADGVWVYWLAPGEGTTQNKGAAHPYSFAEGVSHTSRISTQRKSRLVPVGGARG